MGVQLRRDGLGASGSGAGAAALRSVDAVLRGFGQVMLQDNSYTGALFLLGIFWNSWLLGSAALLGTASGTFVAWLLGADRAAIRHGLYGFNGALVGIALLYFLQPDALTWLIVVVAAAGSVVVADATTTILRRWRIAPLTAPFVLVSWACFLAAARLGRLHATAVLPAAGLPQGTTVEGVVQVATVVEGLVRGVAEVFFQTSLVTGALFVLGLCIASWRVAVAALSGSLVGLLVAWALGAAEPAMRAGAFGFNGALVAIALVAVVDLRAWRDALYVGLALLVTPVVYAALSAALQPLGVPALTFPFVLVTWAFLLAPRHRPHRAERMERGRADALD